MLEQQIPYECPTSNTTHYQFYFKGKSYLTRQLLLKHENVFSNEIKKFYYCFSHWQPVFDELAHQLGSKIEFVPNFNGISFFHENGLDSRTSDSEPIAIILDDCEKMIDHAVKHDFRV